MSPVNAIVVLAFDTSFRERTTDFRTTDHREAITAEDFDIGEERTGGSREERSDRYGAGMLGILDLHWVISYWEGTEQEWDVRKKKKKETRQPDGAGNTRVHATSWQTKFEMRIGENWPSDSFQHFLHLPSVIQPPIFPDSNPIILLKGGIIIDQWSALYPHLPTAVVLSSPTADDIPLPRPGPDTCTFSIKNAITIRNITTGVRSNGQMAKQFWLMRIFPGAGYLRYNSWRSQLARYAFIPQASLGSLAFCWVILPVELLR